jgi:two-component system response regulator VicR
MSQTGFEQLMPRVLLVEDELSAAQTLKTILEMEGFTVTLAANGKRALELLADAQPELIITDYMMPVMNGIEMAQALRLMPTFEKIPILMTSGVSEHLLKDQASFFSAFLRKPFQIDELLVVVARLVAPTGRGQRH